MKSTIVLDRSAHRVHPRRHLLAAVLAIPFLVTGCDRDDDGRWVDASEAQTFFSNAATRQTLGETSLSELNRQCDDLIASARSALDEPASPGLRVLIQVCSKEGLGFGGELRCADDTLQVRCL